MTLNAEEYRAGGQPKILSSDLRKDENFLRLLQNKNGLSGRRHPGARAREWHCRAMQKNISTAKNRAGHGFYRLQKVKHQMRKGIDFLTSII